MARFIISAVTLAIVFSDVNCLGGGNQRNQVQHVVQSTTAGNSSQGGTVRSGGGQNPKQQVNGAFICTDSTTRVSKERISSILKCLENLLKQENFVQVQFDVEMILKLTPESGFDKFRSNLHLHRVKAYSISLNGCPKAIEDATGAIKLNHAADIRQIYREILGDCYVQVGEIPKAVEVYRESWMVEKMGRNDRSAAEMKRKLAEAEQLLQWTLYATNTEPNNKAPANMDYIDAQMHAKKYDNAKDRIKSMLKKAINAPLSPLLRLNLAFIHFETKNYTEAIKEVDAGIGSAIKSGVFFLYFLQIRAKSHFKTKSFQKAVTDYVDIIRIEKSKELEDDLKRATEELNRKSKSKPKTSKNKNVSDQNRLTKTSTKKDERPKAKATKKRSK